VKQVPYHQIDKAIRQRYTVNKVVKDTSELLEPDEVFVKNSDITHSTCKREIDLVDGRRAASFQC
jgi:hypothetical protein